MRAWPVPILENTKAAFSLWEGWGVAWRQTHQHPMACGTRTQAPTGFRLCRPQAHREQAHRLLRGHPVEQGAGAEPGLFWEGGVNRGHWGWRFGQWELSAGLHPSRSRNSSRTPHPGRTSGGLPNPCLGLRPGIQGVPNIPGMWGHSGDIVYEAADSPLRPHLMPRSPDGRGHRVEERQNSGSRG